MKKTPLSLSRIIFICAAFSLYADITFQGSIPPSINPAAINSEYFRIYRIIAPNQRPDKSPLKIIFFSKSFDAGLKSALPEWGGGGAIGDSLIIIPTDFKPFLEQSFPQITVHELVHIVLARAYPSVKIPRWFHEGAAMLLSGELSYEENATISKAIFFGRLMSLSSIDSVNFFNRGRADIAYSQSHLAVLYLVEQHGITLLSEILRATRKSRDFQSGLSDDLGLSLREFEDIVEKYIESRYKLVFFITDSYLWWLLIVLLFIVGFISTSLRNKKRAAAMEEAEQREMEALRVMQMAQEQPPQKDSPPENPQPLN
jgi:hypothetical protein